MNKKRIVIAALLLACMLFASGAMAADSLVGKWTGKAQVTGVPFQLSTTANFNEDGTFSISCFGISATGSYVAGDGTITVTLSTLTGLFASQLQSPAEIGQVELPITLGEDSLSISASKLGLDGTMSLKRK